MPRVNNIDNKTQSLRLSQADNVLVQLLKAELSQKPTDSPATLFWVGELPELLQQQLPYTIERHRDVPKQTMHTIPTSQPQHTACAIVYYHLETSNPPAGRALLAQLRDVLASKVIVLSKPSAEWTLTDFLALGFSSLNGEIAASITSNLDGTMDDTQDNTQNEKQLDQLGDTNFYGFDISDYKRTPDWLNSKYWANPRLWDKYRW